MLVDADRIPPATRETKRANAETRANAESRAKEFACEVALAKASELAHEGRLDQSEHIIIEVLRRSERNTTALDLLARIRYLQGRLAEAELFWRKASEIEPENELFRKALDRIESESRQPYINSSYYRLSIVAAALLLIIGFVTFVAFRRVRQPSPAPRSANGSTSLPAPLSEGPQPDKTLNLNLPGIATRTDGRETVVTFDSGVFQRAASFRPGATKILRELAYQLESNADRLSIRVIGQTDNSRLREGSSYFDNQSLALSRALAVAEFLRTETPLRASTFEIIGAGVESPLYTTDTANARSVELRISRIRR